MFARSHKPHVGTFNHPRIHVVWYGCCGGNWIPLEFKKCSIALENVLKKQNGMRMQFYTMQITDIYAHLKTDQPGLSNKEAQERLQQYGLNTIKGKEGTSLVMFQFMNTWNSRARWRSVFRTPFFSYRFLLISLGLSIPAQLAALHWRPLQFLLKTEPHDGFTWLLTILADASVLAGAEQKCSRKNLLLWVQIIGVLVALGVINK